MVKWAFIGCGDVVQRKSGAPFFAPEQSEVVAVMCRNLADAEHYATTHGVPHFYNDAEAIFADDSIDAVYIATPPSTHMPYAKRALLAGKAVYVEKPMGLTTQECEEVIALAKEKNLPLFVAYYRRSFPMFQEIKAMLTAGEIGAVRFVSATQYTKAGGVEHTWHHNVAISGGGLFHDIGCHTLDILDYLIAPITQVSGTHANQRKLHQSDDIVNAQFTFANGVLGRGTWCFDVAEDFEEVEIIGDAGKIAFAVFGETVRITRGIGAEATTEEKYYPREPFVQAPLIRNVIAALHGQAAPLSTGETALRTVQVMEKVLED